MTDHRTEIYRAVPSVDTDQHCSWCLRRDLAELEAHHVVTLGEQPFIETAYASTRNVIDLDGLGGWCEVWGDADSYGLTPVAGRLDFSEIQVLESLIVGDETYETVRAALIASAVTRQDDGAHD